MRIRHKDSTMQSDTLEVTHHVTPDTAAGAGAEPIAATRSYSEGGMTWRRMLRGIALAQAVALVTLFVAGSAYGLSPFYPIPISALVFGVGALLLPRMTKPGVIITLVASTLMLLFFGVGFFAWTGFMHPNSWFEMLFATVSTLMPIAGIVAAVATLRRRTGDDAARTPSRVIGAVVAAIVLTGVVGSVTSGDATRISGDITISASDFKFDQEAITAHGGDVSIYFENNDPFAHNVEIKGEGTSKDASGRTAIRHVFKGLSAGTYDFLCNLHPEDMKGTLTVT